MIRNFSKSSSRAKGSAIRQIMKLMADPNIISLGGGNPSPKSFPVEDVRKICDDMLKEKGITMLQYGVTCGYDPLRDAYLEHIVRPKGIKAERDDVTIFTGSGQGIFLTMDIFIDEGDVVLMENPTFLGTLNVVQKLGAKCVPVEMDDDGIIIEDLEAKVKVHKPKLLYTIPTFQNPTGRSLPAERRKRIAELAAEYNFIVLEDDPYGDVRFKGQPIPPIKSFDQTGNVILMNSFSKIISPGLRVGASVAAEDIAAKLELVKQGADTHSPILTQAICAEFLNRGLLPGQLEKIAELYGTQFAAMHEGIKQFFPADCHYTEPEGGLFTWLRLPGISDTTHLLEKAIKECQVAFVPGEPFFLDGHSEKDCIRLNYSSSSQEQIMIAMERLGGLIKRERK